MSATSKKDVRFTTILEWVFNNEVSKMSGKFQLDCTQLSPAAVAALKGIGLSPRQRADKPEKGNFITGKSKQPIRIVDLQGNEITAKIGNGTKAIVTMGTYLNKFKNDGSVLPALRKIVVTELVEFGDVEDADDIGIEAMADDVL